MAMKYSTHWSNETLVDLGIGSASAHQTKRFLNRDGSFNVRRRGLPFWQSFSVYHWLIGMSWTQFNLVLLVGYIVMNLVYASIYLALGVDQLGGVESTLVSNRFLDAFFFSAQTFTTVGYGHIHPIGFGASIVASIESLNGLLAFALATGLLYGRFSRPNARILFSEDAVIAPYHDISGFMFRIANCRSNQLIEVHAEVYLAWIEHDGSRKFHQLPLERRKVDFFSLSWTVVHPIDTRSPLWTITPEELERADAEFLVLIKAFDDTFSQTVHARSSYKFHEVKFGQKFETIISIGDDGRSVVDLDRLDIHHPASLPTTAYARTLDEVSAGTS